MVARCRIRRLPAPSPLIDLRGKRGLVIGIANEHSIAAGCAEAFANAGARLAATYLNAKAEPFVRAVTGRLGCELVLPCDVQIPGQLEAVFERLGDAWGGLDFLLHSIAFAPRDDLHGRVTDCSAAGFGVAMSVSCHSFIRMARLAEPLMSGGGCLLAVTFYGSERVVEHYNLMGPVKAALESSMRYVAAELGPTLIHRQREIMDLIVAGHANKEIAARLGINQRTVESHRAIIMNWREVLAGPGADRIGGALIARRPPSLFARLI